VYVCLCVCKRVTKNFVLQSIMVSGFFRLENRSNFKVINSVETRQGIIFVEINLNWIRPIQESCKKFLLLTQVYHGFLDTLVLHSKVSKTQACFSVLCTAPTANIVIFCQYYTNIDVIFCQYYTRNIWLILF
jgi:hypothetical protein